MQPRTPLNFSAQNTNAPSYHVYLTLLGINLAHCFPVDRLDEQTVESVDASGIQAGSKLYVGISRIVDETWTQYTSGFEQQRGRQQQQRAA